MSNRPSALKRTLFPACLAFLLSVPCAARAQVQAWKNLGPWGATIRFLSYSAGGDTLFALSNAGLNRSVGKDGKWEAIPTQGVTTGPVEFAIHGETIVMLGSGLSVSKDLGKTWKNLPSVGRFDHLAYRGGTLYLSRDTLVFRSDDLGETIDPAACAGLTVNTASRKTVIGAMEMLGDTLIVSGGDVFISTDKAETFSTLGTPESPTAIVAMSAHKGDVHTIGNFGKYYTKRIGATTWNLVKTFPSGPYGGFKSMAVGGRKLMITGIGVYDFTVAGETALVLNGIAGLPLYTGGMLVLDSAKIIASAFSSTAAIYRTVNGGTDWQKIDIGGTGVTCFARTDTALYAAGGKDVFRGSPDGSTWKKVDSTLFGTSALGAHSTGLYRFANGMYRSIDGGATWQKWDTGFPMTGFRGFVSGAPGFFALSDSGIHRLADDGASWSYSRPWVNGDMAQAGYASGDTVQVVMKAKDSIRIIHSTDKGAKWTQVGAVKTGSNSNISVTAFFGPAVLIGQDTTFGVLRDGAVNVLNGGPWRYELAITGGNLFVRGKDGVYSFDAAQLPVSVRSRMLYQAVSGNSIRAMGGNRLELEFTLASRREVRLEYYSISGCLIGAKTLGTLGAGFHRVEIDPIATGGLPFMAVLKAGSRVLGASR